MIKICVMNYSNTKTSCTLCLNAHPHEYRRQMKQTWKLPLRDAEERHIPSVSPLIPHNARIFCSKVRYWRRNGARRCTYEIQPGIFYSQCTRLVPQLHRAFPNFKHTLYECHFMPRAFLKYQIRFIGSQKLNSCLFSDVDPLHMLSRYNFLLFPHYITCMSLA